MKVIATTIGFDGKRVRQAGDVFDMPDGSKAAWFAPVVEPETEAVAEPKPAKAKKSEASAG